MKRVTIETTDHSYQGTLVREDANQLLVSYLDENRERIEAWYNKDICEVERVAPKSWGRSGDNSWLQQRALYQELQDDGYVLMECYEAKTNHWVGDDGIAADYLCQFEKDGVKFYLPNNEDWFHVIAVDHENKLALETGFCEYDDIEADHGEYRWVFDGTKLVMGADNLVPRVPADALVLAEVKVESQYPVRWLKLADGDHQITYGKETHTFNNRHGSLQHFASKRFGECVAHAVQCMGGLDDLDEQQAQSERQDCNLSV